MNENISTSKAALQLKTHYALKQKWEPFYIGGVVDVSEDGTYLFCLCGEKVQILDVSTGLVVKVLDHADGDVSCFKVSPSNDFIVTATKSLLLKQWDWIEVKCLRTWKAIHTSPVISLDFDPTSTLLASGGSDGTIKVWDLVNQYCTHNFRDLQGIVGVVLFHPTNLHLYTSSTDCIIKVWDLHTSNCIAKLEGHNSQVSSMKFLSDAILISGGRDNIVAVWTAPNSSTPTNITPTNVIPIFHTVEDLVILPKDCNHSFQFTETKVDDDDTIFATCGSEGILRLWSAKSRKCISSNSISTSASLSKSCYIYAKFLSKFNEIVCITEEQRFDFFNLNNLSLRRNLVGYNDDILDIKMLGKNDTFMVVATNSSNIKVFELSSSSCQILHGHTDIVLCIDVFPNKMSFVSSSKDISIRLWTMIGNSSVIQCLQKISGHTHAVSTVATCQISSSIFASGGEDSTLKIWTIKKVKKQGIIVTARSTSVAHQKVINSVAVSPNDKLVASGSQDKTAKLWELSTGKQISTFHGHKRGVWCVQFSPTDQVLASSSTDGTVKLWSLADGTCLKTLEGHDASVLKLIFIARGTQIVTCGSDGLLKLWTIKSSECILTLDQHSDKIWALSSAHNDQMLYTGSADSTIIAWEDVTEKLRKENAITKENTILQHQELQNLLQEKRYARALSLSIKLNQPFTALTVIKELMWEYNGIELLETTIASLKLDQKQSLFNFIVTWNSNSRNCHEAQIALHSLFLCTTPDEIESFSDAQKTLEALLPYTDRHFQRLSKITQQATFLDYTWCIMKMKPTV